MTRRWFVVWIAVGLFLGAGSGWGQGSLVSVYGTVADENENPLAGALVTLTPERGAPLTQTTGPDGRFDFSVPPGHYCLKIMRLEFAVWEDCFEVKPGMIFPQGVSPFTLQPANFEVGAPLWNSWAASEITKTPTTTLVAGSSYIISFDLAGLDYGRFTTEPTLAARPGPALQSELEQPALTLLYKPFVQGEGLKLRAEAPTAERKPVDLEKLKHPEPYLPKDLAGRIALSAAELSKSLAAFHVDVTVDAEKAGRSVVGLAIWDAQNHQPLDFVALEVTVFSSVSQAVATRPSIQLQKLRSGLDGLRGSPSAPTADASLSVFESGNADDGSLNNTVIFLGRNDFARSWSPRRSIREYVSLDGQFGLVRQLELVQCAEDFEQIGDLFSGVLFSAPDETGRQAASEAKQALEAIVRGGKAKKDRKEWPIVSTRFIDSSGNSLPMPLGLLGVQDGPNAHRLGEVATVTQPLPEDRPVDKGGCIKLVKTILPPSLGLGDRCECAALDRLLEPLVPRDPASLIQDFAGLKSYFTEPPGPQPERQGLLLLSHHVDGFLSFVPSFTPALQAENVTRKYAPGSAAILVGCTVGALTPLNRSLPLLRTLNENGVDAMIFSPFTLNAILGSRLAVHFSAEIERARQKPITLRQLYYDVLDAIQTDPHAKPFLAELNELSLAGSGDIELCPEASPIAAPPVPAKKTRKSPAPGCDCYFVDWLRQSLGGAPGSISTSGPVKSGMGPGERAATRRCREAAKLQKAQGAGALGARP